MEEAQKGLLVLARRSIWLDFLPWISSIYPDGIWPGCCTYKIHNSQIFWKRSKTIYQNQDGWGCYFFGQLLGASNKSSKSWGQSGPTTKFLRIKNWSKIFLKKSIGPHHRTQGLNSKSKKRLLQRWLQGFKDSRVHFYPRFQAFQ